MADRETSQVGIQTFKLKKSIAATILLEILEEDGKREQETREDQWLDKEKRRERKLQ